MRTAPEDAAQTALVSREAVRWVGREARTDAAPECAAQTAEAQSLVSREAERWVGLEALTDAAQTAPAKARTAPECAMVALTARNAAPMTEAPMYAAQTAPAYEMLSSVLGMEWDDGPTTTEREAGEEPAYATKLMHRTTAVVHEGQSNSTQSTVPRGALDAAQTTQTAMEVELDVPDPACSTVFWGHFGMSVQIQPYPPRPLFLHPASAHSRSDRRP